jgi:hypothetical protein
MERILLFSRLFIISLLLCVILTGQIDAQWSTDPSNNLFLCQGILPEACSDSMGGVYITSEFGLGYPRVVQLRHLNRYGYMTWPQKVEIKGIYEETRYASIIADGNNGVFIAYFDDQEYSYPPTGLTHDRLRLQHVDSSGTLLWGPTGVLATLPEGAQLSYLGAKILPDGNGGCLVAWIDSLQILKCQRMDNNGSPQWGDSGLVVTQIPQEKILIAADYKGGMYVSWGTQTNSCIQHVSYNGFYQWDTNTVKMPIIFNRMTTDKSGNIYISGPLGSGQNRMLRLLKARSLDLSAIRL